MTTLGELVATSGPLGPALLGGPVVTALLSIVGIAAKGAAGRVAVRAAVAGFAVTALAVWAGVEAARGRFVTEIGRTVRDAAPRHLDVSFELQHAAAAVAMVLVPFVAAALARARTREGPPLPGSSWRAWVATAGWAVPVELAVAAVWSIKLGESPYGSFVDPRDVHAALMASFDVLDTLRPCVIAAAVLGAMAMTVATWRRPVSWTYRAAAVAVFAVGAAAFVVTRGRAADAATPSLDYAPTPLQSLPPGPPGCHNWDSIDWVKDIDFSDGDGLAGFEKRLEPPLAGADTLLVSFGPAVDVATQREVAAVAVRAGYRPVKLVASPRPSVATRTLGVVARSPEPCVTPIVP